MHHIITNIFVLLFTRVCVLGHNLCTHVVFLFCIYVNCDFAGEHPASGLGPPRDERLRGLHVPRPRQLSRQHGPGRHPSTFPTDVDAFFLGEARGLFRRAARLLSGMIKLVFFSGGGGEGAHLLLALRESLTIDCPRIPLETEQGIQVVHRRCFFGMLLSLPSPFWRQRDLNILDSAAASWAP